jgi:membrane protein implicated in regulation of membrane protease activity
MNTAFDILVIVLSCLLGIFLIISIVSAVLVYKLVKSLRQIVAKGEQLVDSAEALGETLKRNAGAVGILKLVMKFVGAMNKAKKE